MKTCPYPCTRDMMRSRRSSAVHGLGPEAKIMIRVRTEDPACVARIVTMGGNSTYARALCVHFDESARRCFVALPDHAVHAFMGSHFVELARRTWRVDDGKVEIFAVGFERWIEMPDSDVAHLRNGAGFDDPAMRPGARVRWYELITARICKPFSLPFVDLPREQAAIFDA